MVKQYWTWVADWGRIYDDCDTMLLVVMIVMAIVTAMTKR